MVGQDGEVNEYGEGATRQANIPDESRVDSSVPVVWKWGTSSLYDMQIVNLDVGSYLHQTSAKALEMSDN